MVCIVLSVGLWFMVRFVIVDLLCGLRICFASGFGRLRLCFLAGFVISFWYVCLIYLVCIAGFVDS